MRVQSIKITDLRLFRHLEMEPGPRFNAVVGPNGSGKTTVLEAIYLAGRGRSFRHQESKPLVRKGADRATVVCRVSNPATGTVSILGVSQGKGGLEARLDGRDVAKRSVLAGALPLQWIGSNPQTFLSGGPDIRRRFLDMGLFHVEHDYYRLFAEFSRILKQRNAALRQGRPSEVRIWDEPLSAIGSALGQQRQRYCDALMSGVLTDMAEIGLVLNYRYLPGWRADKGLKEQLHHRLERDMRYGYTSVGPQRAELSIELDGFPAERQLSRGQQKRLVFALNLRLWDLVKADTGRGPVMLIDDLAAELDARNRTDILAALRARGGQVFLTEITPDLVLDDPTALMFHVEHAPPPMNQVKGV
jgi:DNA replication and repair protein RecF